EDGNAEGAEALHIGVLGEIAALHLVADVMHDLGDAAHADAADSDEMDAADIEGVPFLHAAVLSSLSTGSAARGPRATISLSTRSARSAAALGRPTPRAASAAAARRDGSRISP